MNFEFRQRKIKPSIIALSICIGLVLGTVFVLLGGYNVLEVYSYLIRGSLGSVSALSSTIRWTTAFLLCGIASGIAFKGGMFNMGTEGQLYMGAISATLVGIYCKGPAGDCTYPAVYACRHGGRSHLGQYSGSAAGLLEHKRNCCHLDDELYCHQFYKLPG